jgi:hypothetical protein
MSGLPPDPLQPPINPASREVPHFRMAPPTEPVLVGYAAARPPRWPVVIGVILIVYASLALLNAIIGLVSLTMIDVFFDMVPGQGQLQLQAVRPYLAWEGGLHVFQGVVGGVGLAAGIALCRRRPSAGRLVDAWIVLQVVATACHTLLAWAVQSAMFQVQQVQTPSLAPFQGVLLWLTSCVGIAWGLALPAFLWVWMRRPTVRDHMKTWGQAAPSGVGVG